MINEAVIAQKQPVAVDVEAGKTYYWCRCGRSNSQPLCDGSHKDTGFEPVAFTAEKSETVYLCGCKQPAGQPFCDGSHKNLLFCVAVEDGRQQKLDQMSRHIPSLFVSHGAPDIILSNHPAVEALRSLPARFARPTSIVIVSAHWVDSPIGITSARRMATIHDFGGFAEELYELQYPAFGNIDLSRRVRQHLIDLGLAAELDEQRGLDHGAWIPLMLMYPDAEIPVTQVSLPATSLSDLAQLGRALSPLRNDGVLIIGSGGSVHNLRALKHNGTTDDWVLQFEDWLLDTIEGNRFNDLISPARFPDIFRQAHPTIEHYAPLTAAWSAADPKQPGTRIHHSLSYGNLGMSMFMFD